MFNSIKLSEKEQNDKKDIKTRLSLKRPPSHALHKDPPSKSNSNAYSSPSTPSDAKILIRNIHRKAKLVENEGIGFLDAILRVM